MRRIQVSAVIEASAQQVWELYADVPGSVDWVPFVEEVLHVSGPAELGQVYRERTRLAGMTGVNEWRVIEWDPPRRQVQLSTDMRMDSRLIIEVEPAEEGAEGSAKLKQSVESGRARDKAGRCGRQAQARDKVKDASEQRWMLRDYALSLPEAYEDFPWDERVAKVRKKVFLFLSSDDYRPVTVGLKLVASHGLGLAQPGVEPMAYGLGKHGWVYVRLGEETPFEMLREWVDESYRAVAPKRLLNGVQIPTAQRTRARRVTKR